jgi:hypothetical protein
MYELQRCPTTLIPLSIVNDGYWQRVCRFANCFSTLMTTREPGVWLNYSEDAPAWKIARRASLHLLRVSQYRMTSVNLVGKLRILRFGTLPPCCAFLRRDSLRTSLTIQRSGLETRRTATQQPPITTADVFRPVLPCYGSCAWDAFGRAGFPGSRFSNLRTAATHSLGNERGGSSNYRE